MLIAIDAFEASAKERVGVGRLEVELLKNIYLLDHSNSYRLYTPHNPTTDMPRMRDNWLYTIPYIKRLWSQCALPVSLYKDRPKPDVFFAPVHYAPRFCPSPIVLGIMDVAFLSYPDLFRKRDLYKLQHWTAYSIKKAQKIITISNSTKNDILNWYGVKSEKVHVVYPGAIGSTYQESNKNMVNKHDQIGDNYILYVGTLQPRKNLIRLIDAYTKVKNQVSGIKSQKLQLVIVGKKGWMYDEIFDKVKKQGLERDVIFTGYVDDDTLKILYQNARCFCLVSLYEGFGFPVLEAMQAGVLVVASNVSSLPELVRGYGELVDPMNTEAISQGIIKTLSLSNDERVERINRAKKHALTFTWERAAKQTIEIIEDVGGCTK